MSYDLMVFDPKISLYERDKFLTWYFDQTEWSEDHDYQNPDATTPELHSWYLEMALEFPSIDDPNYADDVDNSKLTEYNFGSSIIYMAFAWSEMEDAREAVFRLAKKHKIGFFDVSAKNGQVWFPDANGDYRCIHGDCSQEDAL